MLFEIEHPFRFEHAKKSQRNDWYQKDPKRWQHKILDKAWLFHGVGSAHDWFCVEERFVSKPARHRTANTIRFATGAAKMDFKLDEVEPSGCPMQIKR